MDREAAFQLQLVDTNCNDCAHLDRLFGSDAVAATTGKKATVFYGRCRAKNERVTFAPATCMPCNQRCFRHRLDRAVEVQE